MPGSRECRAGPCDRRTLLKALALAPLAGLLASGEAQALMLSSSQYTVKTDGYGAFWVELTNVRCGGVLVTGVKRLKIHCNLHGVPKSTPWTDCRLTGGSGKSHERTQADYGTVTGVEITPC